MFSENNNLRKSVEKEAEFCMKAQMGMFEMDIRDVLKFLDITYSSGIISKKTYENYKKKII